MRVVPGTRLGPYEILGPIGAGGMGEVYRARDTRLDRTVAVKMLPSHLASDPRLRQRFEREARAVSALNHPHICTLHDIGEHDGIGYLVMEYVEGETLAERLAQGPLPFERALRHGVEIADALDRAHRCGIVHRDLKPGNVMLTKTGAKLLDFGLAKQVVPGEVSSDSGALAEDAPTPEKPLTAMGALLGTVQYMAPEQLEGKEADARTDIFAFGSVLYEMLTGRRAFDGPSRASLIGAILKDQPPPVSKLQPLAPIVLDRLVTTCLAKDPDDRLQSAHDVKVQLEWIAEAGASVDSLKPGAVNPRTRARPWMFLALALAAATLLLTQMRFRGGPTGGGVIRSSILPPAKSSFVFDGIAAGPPVLSPDGRLIAFVARTQERGDVLWVRPLDSPAARPLEGTEGASFPFWSPDSRSIGFFADATLKRIEVQGGPPRALCGVSIGRGGSWSEEGTIIFAPDIGDSIYRVPASGGESAPVTVLDESRRQFHHRWPWFLPDGRHFLFFARTASDETTGIYVASLDSSEQRFLVAARSNAIYAPPGYLLLVRDIKTLVAWPFDAQRLEFTGEAIPIADPVSVNRSVQRALVSASSNGILAYRGGALSGELRLLWFDRTGKPQGAIDEPAINTYCRLSPDGQRLATTISDPRINVDVWIYELARGIKTRFTFDPRLDSSPVWSPDGTRIVYASNRTGRFHLFAKASGGGGPEEALVGETNADARSSSWSPDGRHIAYMRRQVNSPSRQDIWILPLVGDRKPFPFLQSEFEETMPAFSPDGRFIAYMSNESARNEVYVTPFPGAGSKWQVSTAGGLAPRWRADGRELFYLAPDNRLVSAQIAPKDGGLEIGAVRPLFQTRTLLAAGSYDVSADGKRFLVVSESESATSEPITLVVNWAAGLHR